MTLIERAFEKNGWKRTGFDESYAGDVYKNDQWPGAEILCGGGFSIRGEFLRSIADDWHKAERKKHRLGLGCGSEYGQLAAFLNFVGPSEEIFRLRQRVNA